MVRDKPPMKKGALLLGYARVSKTHCQDNSAQVKMLQHAGCKRIFEEQAFGGRWDRPQLHKTLEQLREGEAFLAKIFAARNVRG
jgi:DNA invertase Pin-like site-specific DNA recombinase